jgi:hypothetical protein
MDEIKKSYKISFSEHGDSPSAVQWPKGRQEERFKALTQFIPKGRSFSILDFGCGLAHLKDYLDRNYSEVNYTGVDMVDEFISFNRKKYPGTTFMMPEEFHESTEKYDYVVASGVFNILYKETLEAHQEEVFRIFKGLFLKTNDYIAVDFLTNRVDFQQPTSYHSSPEYVLQRLLNQFSRRVIINHSYLPYEFCLTVFRDDTISRPDNIYESI